MPRRTRSRSGAPRLLRPPDRLAHDGERASCDVDRRHEGRLEVVRGRARVPEDAASEGLPRDPLLHREVTFLRLPVADELDRPETSDGADVADRGMTRHHRRELLE